MAVAGHEVACAIAEHHGHAVRTCEHLRILERLLDEFRELHEAGVGLREQRIGQNFPGICREAEAAEEFRFARALGMFGCEQASNDLGSFDSGVCGVRKAKLLEAAGGETTDSFDLYR